MRNSIELPEPIAPEARDSPGKYQKLRFRVGQCSRRPHMAIYNRYGSLRQRLPAPAIMVLQIMAEGI